MKIIFIFVVLLFTAKADYLRTVENVCVINLQPNDGDKGWCFNYSLGGGYLCRRLATRDQYLDGYEVVGGSCVMKQDVQITGLTENQLNYQLYLMGNLVGFSILFAMLNLIVLSARK